MAPNQQCLDLAAQLPGAQVEFDNSQLQLDIAIPKRRYAAMRQAMWRQSAGARASTLASSTTKPPPCTAARRVAQPAASKTCI